MCDDSDMDSRLLAFVGVCALITLVPGLDTAIVTRNVVAQGRRAGFVTALGTSSALFVHAVAVALGVSAILVRLGRGLHHRAALRSGVSHRARTTRAARLMAVQRGRSGPSMSVGPRRRSVCRA